jgi:hypothetical protein
VADANRFRAKKGDGGLRTWASMTFLFEWMELRSLRRSVPDETRRSRSRAGARGASSAGDPMDDGTGQFSPV